MESVLSGGPERKLVRVDNVGQTVLKNHAHSGDWLLNEGTLLDGLDETLFASGNEVAGDVGADEVVAELSRRVASLLGRGLDKPNNTTELTSSSTLLLVGVVVIAVLLNFTNKIK